MIKNIKNIKYNKQNNFVSFNWQGLKFDMHTEKFKYFVLILKSFDNDTSYSSTRIKNLLKNNVLVEDLIDIIKGYTFDPTFSDTLKNYITEQLIPYLIKGGSCEDALKVYQEEIKDLLLGHLRHITNIKYCKSNDSVNFNWQGLKFEMNTKKFEYFVLILKSFDNDTSYSSTRIKDLLKNNVLVEDLIDIIKGYTFDPTFSDTLKNYITEQLIPYLIKGGFCSDIIKIYKQGIIDLLNSAITTHQSEIYIQKQISQEVYNTDGLNKKHVQEKHKIKEKMQSDLSQQPMEDNNNDVFTQEELLSMHNVNNNTHQEENSDNEVIESRRPTWLLNINEGQNDINEEILPQGVLSSNILDIIS